MNWHQFKIRVQRELQRFMYGRNGVDQLTVLVLITSLIISLVATMFNLPWLQLLYYAGVILTIYRILSKDLFKRRKENQLFLQKTRRITSWLQTQKQIAREWKTHRHFKCPNCQQMLRVPKGKGKIKVTCTKCGEQFTSKS